MSNSFAEATARYNLRVQRQIVLPTPALRLHERAGKYRGEHYDTVVCVILILSGFTIWRNWEAVRPNETWLQEFWLPRQKPVFFPYWPNVKFAWPLSWVSYPKSGRTENFWLNFCQSHVTCARCQATLPIVQDLWLLTIPGKLMR